MAGDHVERLRQDPLASVWSRPGRGSRKCGQGVVAHRPSATQYETVTEFEQVEVPALRGGRGFIPRSRRATRLEAERLVQATLGKSRLREPLRLAHLIGQAIVLGESRGRV